MESSIEELGRLSGRNIELRGGAHGHGKLRAVLWMVVCLLLSLAYFFLYFQPVHLHDTSHFATAGVSLVRDHKNLIYPYNPLAPGGMGPAYEFFQNNSIHFDARINYPSKLYSIIFGLICVITGEVRLEYAQWMSLCAFSASVILLYLIGARYFVGLRLACYILAVMLLPVMKTSVSPGTDVYGYLGCLMLVWLLLCARWQPLILGICGGVLSHFRAQMVALLAVFPCIIVGTRKGRGSLRDSALFCFGFVCSYAFLGYFFKIVVASSGELSPVSFYVNHFSTSSLGLHEWRLVIHKLFFGILSLFDKKQLFLVLPVALCCILKKDSPLERGLASAGLIYVLMPVFLYSFDRFAPPQERYFLFAVPLMVLACFLALSDLEKRFGVMSANVAITLFTGLIFLAFFENGGLPVARINQNAIASRMKFLDFKGAQEALSSAFSDDDVVIINHSLPTALSKIHNIIFVPSFDEFQSGDNSKIAGMIFVYGAETPNDYFKPVAWLRDGKMPTEVIDKHGISFKQVYAGKSELRNGRGELEASAYLYVFARS